MFGIVGVIIASARLYLIVRSINQTDHRRDFRLHRAADFRDVQRLAPLARFVGCQACAGVFPEIADVGHDCGFGGFLRRVWPRC